MKVLVKKKIEQLDEGNDVEIAKIEAQRDNELANLEKQRISLQTQINNINQRIAAIKQKAANQISQAANKVDSNAQNQSQQQNNITQQTNINSNSSNDTNESFKINLTNKLFEGKNIKHDLLATAIKNVLDEQEFSYNLLPNEIKRIARKINDIFNEDLNSSWSDVRVKIKDYLLKQTKISFSQVEINSLLDGLETELQNSEYEVFSTIFDKSIMENEVNDIVINFTDDINIDELENEITDLDIDIIDEDFENNTLTLSNLSESKIKSLKDLLYDYYLDEINNEIFQF